MSDLTQYIENKEYIKIQEWFLNHDVLEID
jgi:hypothetical protein